jgi:Flp pilus assembly protein TadD
MDKAESIAQEALTILPQEPSLHFNLANTLGKAGRFAEAEKHFMEAIGLDMKNAVYYTNLGKYQITHDES